MSRSAVLPRVIADICGLPVRVAREPESAALGCAMLIAASAGGELRVGGHGDGPARRSSSRMPQQHERYEAPYAKWRELHERMDDIEV